VKTGFGTHAIHGIGHGVEWPNYSGEFVQYIVVGVVFLLYQSAKELFGLRATDVGQIGSRDVACALT
jgi:hypothetical protein